LTGVTRETFSFIWRNKLRYLLFLIVALCAYMMVEIVMGEGLLEHATDTPTETNFAVELPEALDVDWIILALSTMAIAFFAVPLHNFIINGAQYYAPIYPGRFIAFAVLEAVPGFLWAVTLNMIATSVVGGVGTYILPVLATIALLSGFILVVILPYVATTPITEQRLNKPWKASSGFRLSIFMRVFRLGVAIVIIQYCFQRFSGELHLGLPPEDTILGYYTPILFRCVWEAVIALLFITFASLTYLRLNSSETLETIPKPQEAVS